MHIALYSHRRIPVRGYGGTQRVVVWLARGLMELGHRVTLVAPSGSELAGAQLIRLDAKVSRRPGFEPSQLLPPGIDILHAHVRLTATPTLPHVFTLHGNLRPGVSVPANTIFLSADHAHRYGGTAFVYNGVDPSEFIYGTSKGDYDFFLGRLHPIKGYRWAIEGAHRSGRRIVLAGGWRPSFTQRVRYVGTVDGNAKATWLAGAACLWMPALWDEPFGLTLIEALVSGTPILGTRRGALPEIVSPDVGALGTTLEDLIELRASLERCDPAACRARAERWFTHRRMASEYVRMYQHYLASGSLPAGEQTS
jgi:glycosyltransferase involved in cell wall biosynthesis